jgi:hypothetical protein
MAYNSSDWYQVSMAQLANERAIAEGNVRAAGIRANADILGNMIGTLGNTVGQGLQTILNYKLQQPRMSAETKLLTMQLSRAEREERIAMEEDVSNQMILPTLLRLNNGFGSADRAIQIKTAAELDNFFTEFATKADAPLRISKSTLDTMLALQNQADTTLISDIDDPTVKYSAKEMAAAIRNVNHPLHDVALRQIENGSSKAGQDMVRPFIATYPTSETGAVAPSKSDAKFIELAAARVNPESVKTKEEYRSKIEYPIWNKIKEWTGAYGSVVPAGIPGIVSMFQKVGKLMKASDIEKVDRYVAENKKLATSYANSMNPTAMDRLFDNLDYMNKITGNYGLPIFTEDDFLPKKLTPSRGITPWDVKRGIEVIKQDRASRLGSGTSGVKYTPEQAQAELKRRSAGVK